MINDMKKTNYTIITRLENSQAVMGNLMKGLESVHATMGTCMKNMEHNQTNIGICMKNMEINQANLGASLKNVETQMRQLALSLKENPPKSFPSDTKKNPKQCMVVTLRSGKELDEPQKKENERERVEESKI